MNNRVSCTKRNGAIFRWTETLLLNRTASKNLVHARPIVKVERQSSALSLFDNTGWKAERGKMLRLKNVIIWSVHGTGGRDFLPSEIRVLYARGWSFFNVLAFNEIKNVKKHTPISTRRSSLNAILVNVHGNQQVHRRGYRSNDVDWFKRTND